MESMKKKRNRRLLLQIGLIFFLISLGALTETGKT